LKQKISGSLENSVYLLVITTEGVVTKNLLNVSREYGINKKHLRVVQEAVLIMTYHAVCKILAPAPLTLGLG
jgi:hypothetical protein